MEDTKQAGVIQERLERIQSVSLNLEKLGEMFRYENGSLIRRVSVHYNAKAGDAAGTIDRSTGYVKVNFDGKVRLAHRLVWALVHGKQPPEQIDHRDGNRSNNRIENLRACTGRQNLMNTKARGQYKGVTFNKTAGKHAAQITAQGRNQHLGLYERAEDAARAYDAAAIANFGEFARLNFKGASQ